MFYHLVCSTENNAIGYKGLMPWHGIIKPPDFSIITNGDPIIISKQAFENFGYRLYKAKRVLLISRETMTLEQALTETQDEKIVFIAGGLSIFQQTMGVIGGIWQIKIRGKFSGDTYYPEIPKNMKFVMARNYESDKTSYLYERVETENESIT